MKRPIRHVLNDASKQSRISINFPTKPSAGATPPSRPPRHENGPMTFPLEPSGADITSLVRRLRGENIYTSWEGHFL